MTVYDSLGNAVPVNVTFVMESLGAAGPVWRYYLESADPAATQRSLGSGTVEFDTNGQFLRATGNQLTLDRTAAGATSPLSVTLDFSRINGLSTAASNVTFVSPLTRLSLKRNVIASSLPPASGLTW